MTSSFQQVSKDQFFNAIKDQNVHPRIVREWPYKCEWRLQAGNRTIIGISEDRLKRPEYSNGLTETFYYLPM